MIYFLCPVEGGKFIRINGPDKDSETVIKRMRKAEPCIIVFKDGTIYDAFLKPHLGTDIRSPAGSGVGKAYYSRLLLLKLPEETIANDQKTSK